MMWMDLESIMLTEISQIEKDKYCMISFICGFYKIQQTLDQQKKNILAYRENKLVVGNVEREGRRGRGQNGTNYHVYNKL